MSYGNVYVACVAMGAKDEHTLKAFIEAESYRGPSLLICYSHCIAQRASSWIVGVGAKQQKMAVESGQWILYRYDPRRADIGENPLQLDSAPAKIKVADYLSSGKPLQDAHQEQTRRCETLFRADPVGCGKPLPALLVYGGP